MTIRSTGMKGSLRRVFTAAVAWVPAVALVALSTVAAAPAGATGGSYAGSASSTAPAAVLPHTTTPTHFVWRATANSVSNLTCTNCTIINNAATNGNPNAVIFVQHNWNPHGICSCIYQLAPVGVWYDSSLSKWVIFTEDDSSVQQGQTFNVLVVPHQTTTAFQVTANAGNIKNDSMYINHANTLGAPNDKLMVTQLLETPPSGPSIVYNNDGIGVIYQLNTQSWGIYNDVHFHNMPLGASFNVMVNAGSSGGGTSKIQVTTASTQYADGARIQSPVTTGDANATVFATENFNPYGVGGLHGGTGDAVLTGVYYSLNHWLVYNEDQTTPPINSAFNVLLFPN